MALFSFSKTEEEKAQLSSIDEHFAVISFTPHGTIIKANKNFLDLLGYSLEEVVGKHHRIFCDKEYVNTQRYKDFWDKLAKGEAQISEFKRIKKDGTPIFIQASYTPVKHSNGKVFKVIKFAQDITKKKLENLYYKGQLEAISKSQAVIEFDMSGKVITANKNFLDAFEYNLDEIVGKNHSMFCEESYKNSDKYKEFWEKLNRTEYDAGEYLRIGKNGKKVWIQATYNPIIGIENKPTRVVKYATDISDKKNKMFEIEKNIQQLSDSLKHLSNASESMSNDAKKTMNGSKEVSESIGQINLAVSNVSEKIESMLSSITSIAAASAQGEKVAKEAREQSQTTTSAMLKLDEESEKIGETINIITQIAFQTNILSLNAAVEAATAGEAGKGFAVVAQEVRNLAARSDEAAKEITKAVELIQSLIKNSLTSIHSIDSTIKEITDMSTDISTSIMQQQTISNELSSTALEASQGVNEVTNTMINVSKSAQNTKAESEETQNASEELIRVSSKLISILKRLN
ncbi:methyl-accepting chemotaxis protein [Halarcobacter anaerophilus]|uniref:Chemotaxis protein n=1 Tax=Halarcobacter anaerophilus TaxID=877500 RepID=A0A4Q0XWR7_9BACT|nr:PAS domain-containing methyl-accepting chemotaxis protein [Halarcobacter anaerophilus]QDF28337.1 PAS sensor-containing MCP-domain signal transduction protein [Halarcobacter anaerophilus]RXJ61997.1 chemotaxis protein [Halarcobacter anaerophilus]